MDNLIDISPFKKVINDPSSYRLLICTKTHTIYTTTSQSNCVYLQVKYKKGKLIPRNSISTFYPIHWKLATKKQIKAYERLINKTHPELTLPATRRNSAKVYSGRN